MSTPNFIAIGPTKTGTTWLHRILVKHPDVWLPPVKEVNFFWGLSRYTTAAMPLWKRALKKIIGNPYLWWRSNIRWRKRYSLIRSRYYRQNGLDRSQLLWDLKYVFGLQTVNWYRSLFAGHPGKITGDISPLYHWLTVSDMAQIKNALPDVRIIITLRNPIERAWSNTKMLYVNQGNDPQQLNETLLIKMLNSDYLKLPGYLELLANWQKFFPESQIGVFYYEDLARDPVAYLKSVCKFIGVDYTKINLPESKLSEAIFPGPDIKLPESIKTYLVRQYYQGILDFHKYRPSEISKGWVEYCEETCPEIIPGAVEESN